MDAIDMTAARRTITAAHSLKETGEAPIPGITVTADPDPARTQQAKSERLQLE